CWFNLLKIIACSDGLLNGFFTGTGDSGFRRNDTEAVILNLFQDLLRFCTVGWRFRPSPE
ncbi:hypothetical protein, partial [Thiomicrospira microaerophila]|uniref:hypothetical protein n=1 Tax=Thiomicrospira microaerophila TaxID=406020 RepID=UPI001E2B4774